MNVKVLLFPDGEDPDSFSRKVGTDTFQTYLKENAQDFISFKTRLFVSDAGKDPIKKAETIREIVESIAKIPDPIKRSVYLKECSTLMDIDEGVIITELNKIQLKKNKDFKKLSEQNPQIATEVSAEVHSQKTEVSNFVAIRIQERESIRLLLHYGFSEIENEHKHICNYILDGLSEIEFQTEVYKRILEIFKAELQKSHIPDINYFLRSENDEIRDAVIEMVAFPHEISTNWAEKHKIFIPKEEELLDKVIYENLLRLRYRVIQKVIKDNLDELKNTASDADIDILMNKHRALKKTEMELAKILGIVVSR
jgi:DNA primase